ncbi:MAG: hypothetical protein IKK39_03890 [Thermoguttaceae bacterium]|nr:hypothetical protein [Thermoguttaceae bacterium]MBR4103191.1 hypothetical protein [Thermoguttaceae bacterium]
MEKKVKKRVLVGVGAVVLLGAFAFAAVGNGGLGFGSGVGSATSEVNFVFKAADLDRDGALSKEELAKYEALRAETTRSKGRLEFSLEEGTLGTLRVADQTANDPEALAKIQEKIQMKNASE